MHMPASSAFACRQNALLTEVHQAIRPRPPIHHVRVVSKNIFHGRHHRDCLRFHLRPNSHSQRLAQGCEQSHAEDRLQQNMSSRVIVLPGMQVLLSTSKVRDPFPAPDYPDFSIRVIRGLEDALLFLAREVARLQLTEPRSYETSSRIQGKILELNFACNLRVKVRLLGQKLS